MSAGVGGARALRRSWWPWIPLALVLALALGIGTIGGTGPPTNQERVHAIAKTIECPACSGETVDQSNVEIARAILVDIAQRVDRGETDEQISAFYADRYEGSVLTPTSSGVTGMVWITPVVAFVIALAGLAIAFRRWGEHTPTRATDADRDLVDRALRRESSRSGADS